MAIPKAFISFDLDHDETEKNQFINQIQHSPSPFSVDSWSRKSIILQSEWDTIVNSKIDKCNMLIILSGTQTATATNVIKEISMANSLKVPIFGVYISGADKTTTLPRGLQRNRTLPYDWNMISKAVRQVMSEKKNS
jgi:hypothetical protein